jgi:membrane protease YdiL (CAAX protease family)
MSIRFTIIYVSLISIATILVLFLSGPIWGLRLDYEKGQQIQLIQIGIPTFLSYLSAAVTYATAGRDFPEPTGERGRILKVIAVGGLAIFGIGFALATAIFYKSAEGSLPVGQLSFEQYSSVITLIIGLFGATTSAVATFIFANPERGRRKPPAST